MTDATLTGTGDSVELMSAIVGITTGTTAQTAQTVGVSGFAKNAAASAGTESRNPDACGVYGVGQITGSGIGAGIGAFFMGRRANDTGQVTGVEVAVGNYGTAAGTYVPAGASSLKGIWLHALGNAHAGAGIQLNNPFGQQFKVGIGFGNQVAGGYTGPVADSSIRDDSTSTTSLDIRGVHTNGLDLGFGTFSGYAIRLPNNVPIRSLNAAGDANHNILYYNTFDIVAIGTDSAGVFISPHLTMGEGKNILLGTTTGTRIGGTSSQKLGFWGANAVVRPTGWVAPTGTATRTTFVTSTVTLPDLAERVKALIDNLTTIGIIGA